MGNKAKLALIDCHEDWQALLCLPKGHVDRRGAYAAIDRVPLGRTCLVTGRVKSVVGFDKNDNATKSPAPAYSRMEVEFEDRSLFVRFYRTNPYELRERVGNKITIEGSVEAGHRGPYIKSAQISQVTGRIDPVYSGRPGLVSGAVIEEAIQELAPNQGAWVAAVEAIASSDPIMETLKRFDKTPRWLIDSLHRPKSLSDADLSLVVARQACINEVKASAKPIRAIGACPYNIDEALSKVVPAQPETLSQSQRSALNTIRRAINGARPAHILLNGDVGSGKTLVFLLAIAAVAHASQGRVAVLVPSDLVARQIHKNALARFPELSPCLVSGDASVDASKEAIEASRMYIGTQALLSRDLPVLEAVVVDEQHKLSVAQRNALLSPHTHVIEASATPIPRTLALALFDGWSYAVINHSPVHKEIRSKVVDADDGRDEVTQMIKGHLMAGRKVIFLYPVVSEKKAGSVQDRAKAMEARFPSMVAALHGKLKPEQKIQALEDFRSSKCPIIVASTAIEVGVDVPDVGMMVVSGADRFGASQLHQLRGRLVRNGGLGDFVMLAPKTMAKDTRARLQALVDYADGFALAEKDLALRGFGELLGEMQKGGKGATLLKLSRLEPEDFLAS